METFIICMLAMAGGYAVRVAQEIERRQNHEEIT